MVARRVSIGFALLALGVGALASVANANPASSLRACSDEIELRP